MQPLVIRVTCDSEKVALMWPLIIYELKKSHIPQTAVAPLLRDLDSPSTMCSHPRYWSYGDALSFFPAPGAGDLRDGRGY